MVKRFFVFLLMLLFLLGSAIALWPYFNNLLFQINMKESVSGFHGIYDLITPTSPTQPTGTEEPVEYIPDTYRDLWLDMKEYNQELWNNDQQGLKGLHAVEATCFRLADYGLESEIFGVLSIPSLNLEMPIYLGASSQNMALGAAQMGQTSVPIGGVNTNTVIAGHRGWNGADYFRYVPDLAPGDTVTITNLWQTLEYKVIDTKIISPNDVDAIKIIPGKEIITLFTCHPYASGGRQRFLVFCERV